MRDQFLDLEKQFWDAMKARDGERARSLSDDTSIVIGPQGIAEISRDAIGSMLSDAPYDLNRYAFDEKDVHFRMIGDDVAIIAYRVRERLTVDGASNDLEAFDSTVWVKKNGGWVAALHTESLQGDPYGRDRRAPASTKRKRKATTKRNARATSRRKRA